MSCAFSAVGVLAVMLSAAAGNNAQKAKTDLERIQGVWVNAGPPRTYMVFEGNTMGGGPTNTLSLVELLAELERRGLEPARVSRADWRPSDQKVYISDVSRAQSALDISL